MTFTVLARCDQTGRLGVGIATYSLGVGGYCPFFVRGTAVLSTQAFANPALGPVARKSLKSGRSPARALGDLAAIDPDFEYRQVAIVSGDGIVEVHTGSRCRSWAGHRTGPGFAVFGNVLAGANTVDMMDRAMHDSVGQDLDQRLLGALEAGRDAGGQAGADGAHLPERSAALVIRGEDILRDIDLRVDLHGDAVTELRRVHDGYAPYVDYYVLRARDPANTPAQDAWARDNNIS